MKILDRLLFELEWFYCRLTGKIPTQGDNSMITTSRTNSIDLSALATKAECYDACEAGQITVAEMRARIEEIECAEVIASYKVKIGSTGKFYVSGPACNKSFTAAQILGILSVREQIQKLAHQHADSRLRLKQMKSSTGKPYKQWFQGEIAVMSESSTTTPDGILQTIGDLT